jgi:hypothetical protein
MPPQRSARVAGVAEHEREARSARVMAAAQHAAPALAPLPHALVLHILSLLPVGARLLCAAVCRSWRAALEERSLWIRLDLSASGVSPKRVVTGALLHAAATRARGELVALDLRGCNISVDALLAVANGAALREFRTYIGHVGYSEPLLTALEALLRTAPRLTVCDADVVCHEFAHARCVLRNEPPFALLHVHSFAFYPTESVRDEAALVALAADLTSHAHLRRMELRHAPLNIAAALDAVVDAALTRQLTSVTFTFCELSPESAPALARLIGGGALAELEIEGGRALLDAPAALALGNALRASSTLTVLTLRQARLWLNPAAATTLLGALTGHPSLRSLDIYCNQVSPAGQEEAGAALGALVAANAPALQELNLHECDLGDAGLRPLFDALPANAHLRKLDCTHNELSDAFVRNALLPAVRANASLRKLKTGRASHEAHEAMSLVQRRADAA